MAISQQSYGMMTLALFLSRCSLGLYFLFAGIGKIKSGVEAFYKGGFTSLKPLWLPDWFAMPYGHALPFVEVLVGAALIVGFYGRLAAAVAALALVSFVIALYQAGAIFPEKGGPFHPNVIFLTLAFLLAVTGPGTFSVDSFRGRSISR
ncbi:MAG: DoxX family protein [Phycisphaerae bacterium]